MSDCVSVVIPTCNKSERLALVLDSLDHQTLERGRYEVIVVDDGSNDETDAVVKSQTSSYSLRYMQQERRGRSAARNRGLFAANCTIVLFCDDDTLASPNFLAAHLSVHEKSGPVGVHGKIFNLPYLKFFQDPVGGKFIPSVARERGDLGGFHKFLLSRDYKKNQIVLEGQKRVSHFEKIIVSTFHHEVQELQWLCCTGGNFSAPASLLHEAGGFDENFGLLWGGEDIELGYRLGKLGAHFHYAEEASNYHIDHYRPSLEDELRCSWTYFYQKHPDTIISFLPKLLLGEIDTIADYLDIVTRMAR